jgi:uncharacterized protein involved in exopolysaccharide biosynthesis
MTPAKKWVALVPAVVLAATAFISWPYLPKHYRSETTLVVVPQRVAESYVKATVTSRIEDRLDALRRQVLSRTRLERLILEHNLYAAARRTGMMEDVVEVMRKNIEVQVVRGDVFRVSFTYEDRKLAADIVSELAASFIDESSRDRAVFAESTTSFLESQLQDARRNLVEHTKGLEQARVGRNSPEVQVLTLEEEVLGTTYKSLLTKLADAKLAANLDRRQIGEQVRMLEQARAPEQPLGVTRWELTFAGAVAGLCLGWALVAVSAFRRARLVRKATS